MSTTPTAPRTRLSTFCSRCSTKSEPVEVPSSSEIIELVDALRSKGWEADDYLQIVVCPDCVPYRNSAPFNLLTDDSLDTMASRVIGSACQLLL